MSVIEDDISISDGEAPDKQVTFHTEKETSTQDQENMAFEVTEDAMLELDISEAELEDLKKDFAFFDLEKNGTISVCDFGTVIRGQGFDPSEEELEAMTSQYDSDGRGTLDFSEVVMLVGQQKMKRNEDEDPCKDLIESFKMFDKDNNGFITGPELRFILSHIGENMSEEEIDELMRCADPEGEDRVDYEEFAVQLTSKFNQHLADSADI